MKVDELLEELVRAPSVNPMLTGADEFPDSLGEEPVAKVITEELEKAGINFTRIEVSPGRHNIVAHVSRGPNSDDKKILLSAHMDTYPPETTGSEAFEVKRVGNLMYGRGTADTKGSIACMLHAFIAASKSDTVRESYFVGSVDEEFGLTGAIETSKMDIEVDLAITGEPTLFEIVTCQKGILRFLVRLKGSPCHGAYPNIDESAPMAVAQFISAVRDFNADVLSSRNHEMLGAMSVTPTKIVDSFSHMNLSHEFIDVNLDVRLNPGDNEETSINLLKEYLNENTNLDFDILDSYFYSPPNEADRKDSLLKELEDKVRKECKTTKLSHFQYGSEAGYLSRIASQAIVFGPGDPKFSHAKGECLPIDELKAASRIYLDFLTA